MHQHPTLQVSEMVTLADFKVAGGDLLEGAGIHYSISDGTILHRWSGTVRLNTERRGVDAMSFDVGIIGRMVHGGPAGSC